MDQIDIVSCVNSLPVLKTLAAGFIPLLAYIGADLLFGETIGLFAGIGIGVVEFIVSFAREKKADLFIVADTLLLAVLGALSLLLQNRILFRLKPAIVEGIAAAAMAILLALPGNTLKAYLSHQVKGFVLQDEGLPAVRRSLVLMTVVLALHAGLTAWAAFSAGTALWGFVSGGLLYLMFALALAGEWLSARKRASSREAAAAAAREPFDWCLLIFDEEGRIYATKIAARTAALAAPPSGELGASVASGASGASVAFGASAGATSATPAEVWDSPARGRVFSSEELSASMGRSIAALGFSLGGDFAAPPAARIALSPAFALDSAGALKAFPGASATMPAPATAAAPTTAAAPATLATPAMPAATAATAAAPATLATPAMPAATAATAAAPAPGDVLVFAARVPSAAFPKGVDPTRRRLWPQRDLEALIPQGALAPSFVAEILALSSLRRSLRADGEASIVSPTNGASV